MNAVVDQLKKRNLLEFDDGRYIMWAPGIEIPLTVVKVHFLQPAFGTDAIFRPEAVTHMTPLIWQL